LSHEKDVLDYQVDALSKPAVYLLIPFLRINHIILILLKAIYFANKKGKP